MADEKIPLDEWQSDVGDKELEDHITFLEGIIERQEKNLRDEFFMAALASLSGWHASHNDEATKNKVKLAWRMADIAMEERNNDPE